MICKYCGKEFTAKRSTAKYCSGACKLKASRSYPDKKEPTPKKEEAPKNTETKLTKTDQLFEDHYPNYYKFDDKLYTRRCYVCDKQFTCHLELLKTCSPTCKDSLLKSLTTM